MGPRNERREESERILRRGERGDDQGPDSSGKSHAKKPQEPFGWREKWLADRTGLAQMGLAAIAGNISCAHISAISHKAGCHACLSSQTKRQRPLRGGQR